ncbi:MAG: hypothetical protein QHJ34_15995, partial [bacterium]|nr:hypothetical protein [bacterium]
MADERRLPADPEIVAYATQGAFFTVYDCLDIGKVKVEVATYERGQGQTARAVAYLDAADLRPLVHALKAGQFEALFGGRFESFGGSQRQGSVESRILRLEHDPGEGGRFSRFPLRLTVTNGPGKLTPNGAITPAGEPAARVSIRFPLLDLLRLLLEVEAYLDAYLAANVERLRSERAALEATLTYVRSDEYVMRVAREELNKVQPGDHRVVVITRAAPPATPVPTPTPAGAPVASSNW